MGLRSWSKIVLVLTLVLSLFPIKGIYSEKNQPEHDALQHYLTIHEIEKELARVEKKSDEVRHEINQITDAIELQQQKMASKREKAGEIARAYYMGDRYDLLVLLFNANDFKEMIRSYDLISYILENDQKNLIAFQNEMERLNQLRQQKTDQLFDLDSLQAHLIAQKELMGQIESQLALVMSTLTDQEKLVVIQKQLIHDWEARGIPTFDLFLKTISTSMSGVAKEFKDHISFSINGATLTISDLEFTTYIKKQSELLKDLSITFEENQISFFGKYHGIVFTMIGSYVLESEDLVRFQINQVQYNGFNLPESTAKNLESLYDLGIYPNQINDKLKIKKIKVDEGELEILFII